MLYGRKYDDKLCHTKLFPRQLCKLHPLKQTTEKACELECYFVVVVVVVVVVGGGGGGQSRLLCPRSRIDCYQQEANELRILL